MIKKSKLHGEAIFQPALGVGAESPQAEGRGLAAKSLTRSRNHYMRRGERPAKHANFFPSIKYEYDLISGKVNKVLYQDGKWDQFYYQYAYDADNRLIAAYSSRNNDLSLANWTQEARYRYYLHGPLGRMELGPQVQGMDYAYTLQGWLKGVNGQQIADWQGPPTDMVGDGVASSAQFAQFGRDVVGYSLGYYTNDYSPIGGGSASAFGSGFTAPSDATLSGQPLYNGNIGSATYAIGGINTPASGATSGFMGYTYRYDQLNRLVGMDAKGITPFGSPAAWASNTSNLLSQDYAERASYDGNGNILGYTRNGTSAGGRPQAMDQLTYNYNLDANGFLVNNKLRHINDAVAAGNYPAVAGDPQDLDDQAVDYYSYDKIGNLVGQGRNAPDADPNKINQINWTVYGKMSSIAKVGAQGLSFGYDAGGNRITKTSTAANGTGTTTHYVRDAQGNVLAVYQYKLNASGVPTEGDWLEQHLYGSSRLGMLHPNVVILAGQPLGNDGYGYSGTPSQDPVGMSGSRQYELTNHLGNVLATITDKPLQLSGTMYSAELLSAQDYYPFGMGMPGRSYIAGSSLSGSYRYGFNGKEKDDEVMGAGNEIDYGMRVYDPRAGRFMSVDPLTKKYPWYTPYQFAGNTPIQAVDLDGREPFYSASSVTDRIKRDATYINKSPLSVVHEEQVLMKDVYGNALIGNRSVVENQVKAHWAENFVNVGQNIANGPGGAVGYLIGGSRGSYIGAAFDQIALSFGGIPGETSLSPRYKGTDLVAMDPQSRNYEMSEAYLDQMTYDPDTRKMDIKNYQEYLVALSVYEKVGWINSRAPKGTGADFVASKVGRIDVKLANIFIEGLANTKKFNEVRGMIGANKDVTYVLDLSGINMSRSAFENNVLKKYYDAGVDKSRVILADTKEIMRTTITITNQ